MRLFIALLVVLALAGGGYYVWSKAPRGENGQGADRTKTAVVEARNIEFAINAAGDIGPADQVSGLIVRQLWRAGARAGADAGDRLRAALAGDQEAEYRDRAA